MDGKPMPGIVLRVWWVVVLNTALWLGVLGLLMSWAVDSLPNPWARVTGGTALGVVTVVAGVRTLRSSLRVDGEGIVVRNTWRTRSWRWDQVSEVGWDAPALSRGGTRAVSVCATGDPYTHTASATTTGGQDFVRLAAQLGPYLAAHGVDNRLRDPVTTRMRWWADPRNRDRA